MTGGAPTHAGHRAPIPDSPYESPPPVARTDTGLDVPFVGEDGRRTVFRVGRLPLPGWHAPLAEAFAERVDPAGTRRTLSSAAGSWTTVGRFLRFLDGLPRPPETPRELTAAQVDTYLRHRVRSAVGQRAWEELTELRQLFRQLSMRDLVDGRWATTWPGGWTRGAGGCRAAAATPMASWPGWGMRRGPMLRRSAIASTPARSSASRAPRCRRS